MTTNALLQNSEVINPSLNVSTETFLKEGRLTMIMQKNNAGYRALQRKKRVDTYPGGPLHVEVIAGQDMGNYTHLDGIQTINIEVFHPLQKAQWTPSMIAASFMIPKSETLNASGPDNKIDLKAAYVQVTMESVANRFSVDLYSNGMLANQIDGLGSVIQATPGPRYATIPTSRFPLWVNQSVQVQGTPDYESVMAAVDECYIKCNNGGSMPDLGLTTHDFWLHIIAGQRKLTRYGMESETKEGRRVISYLDMEIMYDHNANFGTNDQKLLILNTNYLFLKEHEQAQWTVESMPTAPNMFGEITRILWMGFFGCDFRNVQGIVYK